MKHYYQTPRHSVALNAKVGSSTLARAIIREFQPRDEWLIQTAAFPPGVTAEDRPWHWLAHGSATPTGPVVLLVREPVERFVSACQQLRIHAGDIDRAIESLATDAPFLRTKPDGMDDNTWRTQTQARQAATARRAARRLRRLAAGEPAPPPRNPTRLRLDVHFAHQHSYIDGPTTCFRFPRDLEAAAAFLGIRGPLPKANQAKTEKPRLTRAQATAVRDYYATDVALFESITAPATVVQAPAP